MKQLRLITASLLILLLWIPSFSIEKADALHAARVNYEQGKYFECADYYEKAIKLGSDTPKTYYNYARCLALYGERDKAFDNLEKALDKGFVDIDMLKKDKQLNTLHKDKRWLVIVSKGERILEKYLESINVWVYRMFQSDQEDRKNYKDGDDWEAIAKKDSMRQERILKIIEKRDLKASDDYYHAAMIMHHGTDSTDYKLANELASKAVGLDSANLDARWLYAASKDRYLLKVGKPQIYGTQYNYKDGLWTLEPFDKKTVSDKERQYWQVPTIGEAQRKVGWLNSENR